MQITSIYKNKYHPIFKVLCRQSKITQSFMIVGWSNDFINTSKVEH